MSYALQILGWAILVVGCAGEPPPTLQDLIRPETFEPLNTIESQYDSAKSYQSRYFGCYPVNRVAVRGERLASGGESVVGSRWQAGMERSSPEALQLLPAACLFCCS